MFTVLLRTIAPQAYEKYWSWTLRIRVLEFAAKYQLDEANYGYSPQAAFTGQWFRREILKDLAQLEFQAAIETGTWIGDTTGYIAEMLSVPVYSCDSNDLLCLLAKKRLERLPNIHIETNDSRNFLKGLVSTGLGSKNVFVYLDAHWFRDLPLAEEIEIIASNWENFVIMIDDFRVPWDSGYAYDDYGKNKTLSLACFSQVIEKHSLVPFFPALASSQESGLRRGCVVLARRGAPSAKLAQLKSLVQHA